MLTNIMTLKSRLESLKVIGECNIGQIAQYSIVTMSLSCTISEIFTNELLLAFYIMYGHNFCHFRDKVRYWSKIVIFHTPPVFHAPAEGDRVEFRLNILYGKTRIVGLPEGEKVWGYV